MTVLTLDYRNLRNPFRDSAVTTDDPGTLQVTVLAPDTADSGTEATAAEITASVDDTPATPTEATVLEISPFASTQETPTETRTAAMRVGATTVTQTTGTGWVTPANAQSISDGTNSTLTSPAQLNPPSVSGTLTASYASAGTFTTETVGALQLVAYLTLTVSSIAGTATGSLSIATSVDGGAFTTLATYTSNTPSPQTFTVPGLTTANLQTLLVRVTGTVQGTALQTSSATVDALEVTIPTSNG